MAELTSPFQAADLTEAVNLIVPVDPFIVDLVFPASKRRNHKSSVIEFEIRTGNNNIARFTRGGAPASVVGRDGRTAVAMKLPIIREKKVTTAHELLPERGLGMKYDGNASPNKLVDQRLSEDLTDLKDRAMRRIKLMVCQALQGKVSGIDGDGISFEADYGFLGTHKISLSGTQAWSKTNSNVPDDIEKFKNLIIDDSGLVPDTVVLGRDAAAAFKRNKTVMEELKTNNFRVGALDLSTAGKRYLGPYLGMNWYEYREQYTTTTTVDGVKTVTKHDMFPVNGLSMYASDSDRKLDYGGIEDFECANPAVDFFSKSWVEKDPSGVIILTETRPLPVIREPNAFLFVKVTE